MTRTLPARVHVCHSYASCGQSPYVATFHTDPIELNGYITPEKKCFPLHLSVRLSGPRNMPQFLSQHNHWSSALKPSIYWRICYIGLLGPHRQHVINTFNTCSWGPTHWSLTDTSGGYNIEGVDFPHHSSHPYQSTVLRFPLWVPSGLRLTIINKNLSTKSRVIKP
jgi:hypothetical protein